VRALPPSLAERLSRNGEGLTVLVVRLSALGDLLRTLPAVRLLRRALPLARLVWVVEDRWTAAIEGHADLDRLLVLPRKMWSEMWRSPRRWAELLVSIRDFRRRLRSEQADLAIDFHGNLRSGVAAWCSGAPVRLGYDGHQQKEGNRWFTTHRRPAGERRTSRIDRNLGLLGALDLAVGPLPQLELPLASRGAVSAAAVLREALPEAAGYAIVNPGASRAQQHKKPPAALLAAACRRLAARKVLPLVVWGPGEKDDAMAVVAAAGGARLAPPTELATLAALLAGARLFVGGDSGPLHLACATGCPVLALYGPTDPEVNRPWAVPYRAIHPPGRIYTGIKRLDRRHGFDGLAPRAVEQAIDELLSSGARSDRGAGSTVDPRGGPS